METRYSKNREVIRQVLTGTKTHPDAEWIYGEVRKSLPGVGIATVYRNLRSLVESGEIMEIESKNGTVRYEANLTPHAHFVCDGCGEISDIDIPFVDFSSLERDGYEVKRGKIVLYGVCRKCAKN